MVMLREGAWWSGRVVEGEGGEGEGVGVRRGGAGAVEGA